MAPTVIPVEPAHKPLDSGDATKNIRPRMRHHAGPQAPAPNREQAIQSAKARDLHACFDALVTVRNPEHASLQKPCNPSAVRKNLELFLEVTAKDQLFAESGANGNANP